MLRLPLVIVLSLVLGAALRPYIAGLKPRPELTVSPRIVEFEGMNDQPVDIIMLGNSLTDRGRWNELLELNAANRGIGRDTVAMVAQRAHLIPPSGPIYLMIGVNDLIRGRAPKDIKSDYAALLSKLEHRDVIVQSVIGPDNLPIPELNMHLEQLAFDMNVKFLDLTLVFGHPIRKPLTLDGVHLTGKGYAAWARKVRKHLESERASLDYTTANRSNGFVRPPAKEKNL